MIRYVKTIIRCTIYTIIAIFVFASLIENPLLVLMVIAIMIDEPLFVMVVIAIISVLMWTFNYMQYRNNKFEISFDN